MPRIFPEKGFVDPKEMNTNIGIKVITHAVSNKSTFFKIVKGKKIDLPSITKPKKKTPYVENLFGLHECIYFSAGFDYNSKFHQWDFAFLFRKSILHRSHFNTFKSYIVAKPWFVFLKYLKEHDLNTLLEAKKISRNAKKYIERFLETGKPGYFWQYEDALIWAFENTKVKNKVKKEMMSFIKSKKLKNSYAPVYIGKHYHDHFDFKEIEICSTKPVSLNDDSFVGVYVNETRMNEVISFLKKSFPGKILIYDGNVVNRLDSF